MKYDVLTSRFKDYPAKLLLVGEYSIIDGGSALALPYRTYSGTWKRNSNGSLGGFFNFLKSIGSVDQVKIDQAIDESWSFDSSIPQGFGLGSSGALTAAAYDSFVQTKPNSLKETQLLLAKIESFFHGKSSGLDPLVSYTNSALFMTGQAVESLDNFQMPTGFEIYNSNIPRVAKNLIDHYQNVKNELPYRSAIDRIKTINAGLIDACINGDLLEIGPHMEELSHLQLAFFERMVPKAVKEIWTIGLTSKMYSMKLCGAGGGGFFIIYNNNAENPIGQRIIY